jgi:adenosine deaminase
MNHNEMTSHRTTRPLKFYQSIPKIDLHRHVEGSVRLSTLVDVGRTSGKTNVEAAYFRSLVQVMDDEPFTFENFLSKFSTLRNFFNSPDVIRRITYEAIEDASVDNIRYLELLFTPVALSCSGKYALSDVMDWVINAAREGEKDNEVVTRLVPSINRHESLELAEQVIQLAVDRKGRGIVGVDMAGNEADFPASKFIGAFNEAKEAGLAISIHAGEWGGAANVREAIEDFRADRIGHGVRILEDAAVVEIAREHQTVFEVCITSNYQTGVVPVLQDHPLKKMRSEGLNTTLNTDDPSISQITLSHEYKLACEELRLTSVEMFKQNLAAVEAAFLPRTMKDELVADLEAILEQCKA